MAFNTGLRQALLGNYIGVMEKKIQGLQGLYRDYSCIYIYIHRHMRVI